MKVQENYSLKHLNTFGIDARAEYYVEVNTVDDLQEIIRQDRFKDVPKLILGGGSNLLFTRDVKELVIKNNLKGIEKIREDQDHVWVRSMSGEIWHELVEYSIAHNYGGIENLSLIPGSVGAAPIQNIGAYGVELVEVFDRLEAIHLETGKEEIFTTEDCKFGYRNSVFKNEHKGKYFVVAVILKLNKHPRINVRYGAIQNTLEEMSVQEVTIQAVSEAVCKIRSSKLPNPAEIGNAGSFFKNPEVPESTLNKIQETHPDVPNYPVGDGLVKIPAGWLIEQCGWKGKKVGNTGSHKNQALVLVNYGGATGEEIKQLAFNIQNSVKEKFGIELQPEVNIY